MYLVHRLSSSWNESTIRIASEFIKLYPTHMLPLMMIINMMTLMMKMKVGALRIECPKSLVYNAPLKSPGKAVNIWIGFWAGPWVRVEVRVRGSRVGLETGQSRQMALCASVNLHLVIEMSVPPTQRTSEKKKKERSSSSSCYMTKISAAPSFWSLSHKFSFLWAWRQH